MECSKCSFKLRGEEKFCSNCGAAVPLPPASGMTQEDSDPASATTTEAMKRYAKDVVHEAGELSKTALKSDLGKKMAAGAGIGAVIAVPIPFVGPAVGAVVGAGIVAFRRLTKG
jgi:hypothetical protein